MRRRDFIVLGGAALVGRSLLARRSRTHLSTWYYDRRRPCGPRMAAFFDELKVFGFVEGQNLDVVAGGFETPDDQFAGIAATLAKAAPNAVFCVGDAATRAMQGIGPPGSYRGPIHRFGSRGFRALTGPTQWQYHGGHGKRLEPSRSCSVRDVSGPFRGARRPKRSAIVGTEGA